jgi:secreted trypsin-like serine protease
MTDNGNKIFGGTMAAMGEFPWQVTLLDKKYMEHQCGAALIHPKWVLTAAHCSDVKPEEIVVRMGETNVLIDQRSKQTMRVKRIINHPNFDNPENSNDISLLELEEPMSINENVSFICLPQPEQSFELQMCQVSGFGATETTRESNELLKVQKPIMNSKTCQELHRKYKNIIYNTNLCANTAGGKDACKGDSGGALVCKSGSQWVAAGIVSYGDHCGLEDSPGIYTRVTEYLDWIEYHTKLPVSNGSQLKSKKEPIVDNVPVTV